MARYEEPDEVRAAEAALNRLRPLLRAQHGAMKGISDLTFTAGLDYRGEPSITFRIEFAAGRPEPSLDQTNELEQLIRDTVLDQQTEITLSVYFRYGVEDELPLDDGDSEAPPAAQV